MNENKDYSQAALTLFEDWNKKNIRYCHWKSNEHLAKGVQGNTDLDILIDPIDAGKANVCMVENGYKRTISHKWKSYSGVEDWVGMDPNTLVQTHLHIHYRLLTGLKNVKEQYFPWEQLVLDYAVKHEDFEIYICDPNIEIIILLCRAAIKKDFFTVLRKPHLSKAEELEYKYLLERIDHEKVNKFIYQMLSGPAGNEMEEILGDLGKVNLVKLRKKLLKEFSMLQRESRQNAFFKYYRRIFLYKASKMIHKPIRLKKNLYTGGKLVSFIGADGAGKTTLATFFAEWLSWKIDCRYVYLGTGDGRSGLLNRVKKNIVKRRKSIKKPSSDEQERGRKQIEAMTLKKQLKTVALNYICLSNDKYKYKMIRRIFKMVNKGCVVITDRYPQMEFEGVYDGMTITSFTGNKVLVALNERMKHKEVMIYNKMCEISPDIIIKLDIPLEVSVERKPCTGHALELVKKKIDITQRLHYKNAKEYVIKPIGELNETKREICNILWELI